MMRRLSHLAVAFALLAPGAAIAQRTGTPIQVQAAVGVEPDTVRIGDPFLIQIGIRAPLGATVAFPPAPDSTGAVQGLDPVRVETRPDSGGVVQWGYYRVAAWDIGDQSISLGDVVVTVGGRSRRIPIAGHKVFIESVLPADTALRVPKPARALYEFAAPWWWIWAALAALALLLLLLWWWWRNRKRSRPVIAIDPFLQAERDFARVEALGLVDAGERGRYVALVVEVLRDYLSARYAAARLSLTSTELNGALGNERAVPNERLVRVLNETDLIKFARRQITADRARELGREARAIVAHEHRASTPATAPEKAA
ncbi:MAG TPA: hypothetical protein VJO33_11565 [Gemmatimonadaceae bacterium]|nr:hypothetical protein [Gemmatimonadaceae bacterium]